LHTRKGSQLKFWRTGTDVVVTRFNMMGGGEHAGERLGQSCLFCLNFLWLVWKNVALRNTARDEERCDLCSVRSAFDGP
jgi:hypothetical protein